MTLKKRIIPCLDIKDGQTVKGINFVDVKNVGDPVELAKKYVAEGADELVFLDITATLEKRKAFAKLVSRIAKEINIPFTVGGGISSVVDAKILLDSGADKVSINSSAVKNPTLVHEIADEFGSQFLVVAIDVGLQGDEWFVYVKGGTISTNKEVISWAKEVEALGAGEILLTSIQHDGTKKGFAIDLTSKLTKLLNIPVIASGGAGNPAHFAEVFKYTRATGSLAASIFHSGEVPIPKLKQFLKDQKIEVRI